jgi:hypothetical protein
VWEGSRQQEAAQQQQQQRAALHCLPTHQRAPAPFPDQLGGDGGDGVGLGGGGGRGDGTGLGGGGGRGDGTGLGGGGGRGDGTGLGGGGEGDTVVSGVPRQGPLAQCSCLQ